jgi:hypothetical protein
MGALASSPAPAEGIIRRSTISENITGESMIRTVLLGALLCVLFVLVCIAALGWVRPAYACDVMRPCGEGVNRKPIFSEEINRKSLRHRHFLPNSASKEITHHGTARPMSAGLARVMAEGAGRVVAHPSGCPRRAFCGCGAAVRIFGKPIRSLWLAAEWLRRFPRAQAARGMAAVRRDGHHIVVLEEHISGALWRVYDANSGRHRTRVHLRSIAGWTIVDPRG